MVFLYIFISYTYVFFNIFHHFSYKKYYQFWNVITLNLMKREILYPVHFVPIFSGRANLYRVHFVPFFMTFGRAILYPVHFVPQRKKMLKGDLSIFKVTPKITSNLCLLFYSRFQTISIFLFSLCSTL